MSVINTPRDDDTSSTKTGGEAFGNLSVLWRAFIRHNELARSGSSRDECNTSQKQQQQQQHLFSAKRYSPHRARTHASPLSVCGCVCVRACACAWQQISVLPSPSNVECVASMKSRSLTSEPRVLVIRISAVTILTIVGLFDQFTSRRKLFLQQSFTIPSNYRTFPRGSATLFLMLLV